MNKKNILLYIYVQKKHFFVLIFLNFEIVFYYEIVYLLNMISDFKIR